MAGGIFVNKPFSLNISCVLFGFLMIIMYHFLPDRKDRTKWMFPLIFIVSYVAMAWYDWFYDCDKVLPSGTSKLNPLATAIFKPQRRDLTNETKPEVIRALTENPVKNQEQVFLSKVYIFHVLLVAPLILWIGWKGTKTNPALFNVLLGLGGLALFYHGFRLFVPRETND